jgi:hypothetical protein
MRPTRNAIVTAYKTPEEIVAACHESLSMAPTAYPPDLPAREDLLGAPGWYSFENSAWPIGEDIRQSFKAVPKLKRSPEALEAVMSVVEQTHLRRGRQSFVMALGFTAASFLAGRVACFLSDKDVDGQVIDTLLKMRAPGFVAAVRPLLEADKTWIRNLAKKYVQRYTVAA